MSKSLDPSRKPPLVPWTRWPVVFGSVLSLILGLQAARLWSVVPPWPDNPGALLAAAFINWSNVSHAGLVLVLYLAAVALAKWRIYSRMPGSVDDFRRFLRVLYRRKTSMITLFFPPVLIIIGSDRSILSFGFVLTVVFFLWLPFVLRHRRLKFYVPLAMLMFGFANVNFFVPEKILYFQCRPNAQLIMHTGERLACQHVTNLPETGLLVVDTPDRRIAIPTDAVEIRSLETSLEGKSYLIR